MYYHYVFNTETCALISICDGFVTHSDGKTYYYPTYGSGEMVYGLNKIDGYYYYFSGSGVLMTGVHTVQPYNSNGILTEPEKITFDTEKWYAVDVERKPITEFKFTYPRFLELDGKTYCYIEPGKRAYQFNKIGDYYYYFSGDGSMFKGTRTIYTYDSNGLLTKNHTYTFDAEKGYAVDENGVPLTTPHISGDGKVVSPTCTEQGYTLHSCIYCDQEYRDKFVDPEGHTLVGGDTPEWKYNGEKHWHECEKCDTKVDEAEHSYENGDACDVCGKKKFITGDVNGDGAVDQKDVLILRRNLAGWDVEIDLDASDVNGDTEVDQKDVLILRRYLAGWDVTLGGNA